MSEATLHVLEPAATDAPAATGAVRDAVADVADAVTRLQRLLSDDARAVQGDFGALADLLPVIDRAQACAVTLADNSLTAGLAMRSAALGFEGALAMDTRATFGECRQLAGLAEGLRHLPILTGLWHAGQVSTATVRAVLEQASRLPVADRQVVDQRFADAQRVADTDPDELIGQVVADVDRRLPRQADQRELRRFEQRFVAIQPRFDGALSFYGELDPEGGATFLEALQAAAPRPVLTDWDASDGADTAEATDEELAEAQEQPLGDPLRRWARKARGRQLADGLVAMAERFLAGDTGGGRRPKPRLYVWADVRTLTGDDPQAQAGRALAAAVCGRWSLTPEATRRLAQNADCQFILADGTHILGVSAPSDYIPANVRAAVAARDQGCRFPGCSAPVHWCDLHHVIAREDGGFTIVANLVALCRRHHTAVTQGRWRLSMTDDGVVTVRRGRRRRTSHPPPAATGPPGDTQQPRARGQPAAALG